MLFYKTIQIDPADFLRLIWIVQIECENIKSSQPCFMQGGNDQGTNLWYRQYVHVWLSPGHSENAAGGVHWCWIIVTVGVALDVKVSEVI